MQDSDEILCLISNLVPPVHDLCRPFVLYEPRSKKAWKDMMARRSKRAEERAAYLLMRSWRRRMGRARLQVGPIISGHETKIDEKTANRSGEPSGSGGICLLLIEPNGCKRTPSISRVCYVCAQRTLPLGMRAFDEGEFITRGLFQFLPGVVQAPYGRENLDPSLQQLRSQRVRVPSDVSGRREHESNYR